jgi:hypothetical protein
LVVPKQWRLETVSELEALKIAMGEVSESAEGGGSASSSSSATLEHQAMLRALRARLQMAGPHKQRLPRHPTHGRPSFLELNGITCQTQQA